MTFNPSDPANRAKFLRDNPEMTDKDYDRIFGIKKEQPSFKNTDANRKKFLKDNPNKTNKDFDNLFKAKGGEVTSEFRMGGKVDISNFKGQF
tara:strand:+ start:305 stop:580 length:276 start_codon:yes stop_codon:yes gene_type:complete